MYASLFKLSALNSEGLDMFDNLQWIRAFSFLVGFLGKSKLTESLKLEVDKNFSFHKSASK